jgi:hypothetical protein
MGTRGTISIIVNDTEKTVYNHYDSYADGIGVQLLDFVRTLADDSAEFAAVSLLADQLRPVPKTHGPSEEEKPKYQKYHENVSAGDDWYAYLRKTQGDIPLMLEAGLYEPWSEPGSEEYHYVINLDAETFSACGYYDPVSYQFSNLPSNEEFVAEVNADPDIED